MRAMIIASTIAAAASDSTPLRDLAAQHGIMFGAAANYNTVRAATGIRVCAQACVIFVCSHRVWWRPMHAHVLTYPLTFSSAAPWTLVRL